MCNNRPNQPMHITPMVIDIKTNMLVSQRPCSAICFRYTLSDSNSDYLITCFDQMFSFCVVVSHKLIINNNKKKNKNHYHSHAHLQTCKNTNTSIHTCTSVLKNSCPLWDTSGYLLLSTGYFSTVLGKCRIYSLFITCNYKNVALMEWYRLTGHNW